MRTQEILNKYFILFSDCKLVDGHSRSIVYDLTRSSFNFIPNILYEILTTDFSLRIEEIVEKYGIQYQNIILEYFDFLEEKEYIFFTTDPNERLLFPPIDNKYESPYEITNVIIDYDDILHPIEKIIKELEILGSVHLQLRFYSSELLGKLNSIVSSTLFTRVKSIELILPQNNILEIEHLIEKHHRIKTITLFAAETISHKKIKQAKIFTTQQKIISESCCGQIQPSFFTINTPFFNESSHYNNCLNKKISIDTSGRIKNCPSMRFDFGNINEVSLIEVVKQESFKSFGYIKKDEIETCKICEFRYMCLDCRAYIDKPDNIYSKPLKCGYNPITNEWKEWSTNPLKEDVIKSYKILNEY